MSSNHQPHLSINSIQSLIEPVTPPSLGQMNNKKNHQKTHSLDLSVFNQFITSNTPIDSLGTSSSSTQTSPLGLLQKDLQQKQQLQGYSQAASLGLLNGHSHNITPNLPLIDEFDISFDVTNAVDNLADNSNVLEPHLNSVAPVNQVNITVSPLVPEMESMTLADNKKLNSSSMDKQRTVSHSRQGKDEKMKGKKTPQNNRSNNQTKAKYTNKLNDVETDSINMTDISNTPLKELDYVKLATDQFGCRFLQKKLETPSESNLVRDLMYDQIKPYFLELILDPFGNYLIQKLCDFLTPDQRTALIEAIYPNVFQISINQYGTRSLQKIIDTVDDEQQINLIVKGFSNEYTSIRQVVTLINDLNGNHVIQKCIFKFPASKFDFIIAAIIDQNNIIAISTHKHGCCVLQKLLSVCTLQQTFKISVKIVQFLPNLINDQFGNYIIQFLLDIEELDFYMLAEFYNRLSGEICQLSCLKFSSNVVEKLMKKLFSIISKVIDLYTENTEKYRNSGVLESLILPPTITEDIFNAAVCILIKMVDVFTMKLNLLIRDNFGNYALQTLLDIKNYGKIISFYSTINKEKFQLESDFNKNICNNLSQLSTDFGSKISNLVILTKELLPSIKTTSYAKKIKLKVKAYAEFTGVPFTELTSKKQLHSDAQSSKTPPNNRSNRVYSSDVNNIDSKSSVYAKQHARHYSLPSNTFNGRSTNTLPNTLYNYPPPTMLQNMNENPYNNDMFGKQHNIQSATGYGSNRYVGGPLLGNISQYPQIPFIPPIEQSQQNIPTSFNTMTPTIPGMVGRQGSSSQSSVYMMNDNCASGGSSSSTLYPNGMIGSFSDVNPNQQPVRFKGSVYPSEVIDNSRQQRIVSSPYPQYGFANEALGNQKNSGNTNDNNDEAKFGFGFH